MFDWLMVFSDAIKRLILVCAVLCVFTLIGSLIWARKINKHISSKNEKDYKETTFNWINFHYNVFVTLVSVFPLLGMAGTVLALWGLDLTSGATEDLKQQFFLALDTTAAGLFFSILFKSIHALLQTYIERSIAKNEELVQNTEKRRESNEEKDN